MKNILLAFTLAILAGLITVFPVLAQDETLTLSLSRDWGYGGFGGDIQGTFSFHVRGPSNLVRVEYYIDALKIGEDTAAPFNLQFVTDNYPLGAHELYALGYTDDGKILRSNSAHPTFVPASEGGAVALKIVAPMLVLIFGAMILSVVIPLLTGRKTAALAAGTQRQYTLGGGVCPKCSRPFAFHLLSMNMLTGKLTRCPYCGRWSIVRRVSIQELRAAEQAEIEAAKGHKPEASEEEKLKKELEDSKYQGL
jgi:DNA-directed RNA polymerase subunit RPC12/RpoP